MGFSATDVQFNLGQRRLCSVFANEILLLSPGEIRSLFFDKFPNCKVDFLSVNKGKDIYLGTKSRINYFDLEEVNNFCKLRTFFSDFCKIEQIGWIDRFYMQFPNSEYDTSFVTYERLSDPMNKEMVTVKSSDMLENCDYAMRISFPQKSTDNNKNILLKLLTDWEEEARTLGFNNEKIATGGPMEVKDSYVKMHFSYTGPIHFPFLELYLRLYSTPLEMRPIAMRFSTPANARKQLAEK